MRRGRPSYGTVEPCSESAPEAMPTEGSRSSPSYDTAGIDCRLMRFRARSSNLALLRRRRRTGGASPSSPIGSLTP